MIIAMQIRCLRCDARQMWDHAPIGIQTPQLDIIDRSRAFLAVHVSSQLSGVCRHRERDIEREYPNHDVVIEMF